jgi:hypothetical protein
MGETGAAAAGKMGAASGMSVRSAEELQEKQVLLEAICGDDFSELAASDVSGCPPEGRGRSAPEWSSAFQPTVTTLRKRPASFK